MYPERQISFKMCSLNVKVDNVISYKKSAKIYFAHNVFCIFHMRYILMFTYHIWGNWLLYWWIKYLLLFPCNMWDSIYGLVSLTLWLYFWAPAYFINVVCRRQWEGGWYIPPSITLHLVRLASAAKTRGLVVTVLCVCVCVVRLVCCLPKAIKLKKKCSNTVDYNQLSVPTWHTHPETLHHW